MFRTLALIAMRQKQHQSAHSAPFGLTGAYELIDDHLRTVRKIAELTLPNHERVRLGCRIAIFEAHNGLFGQDRIDDFEARLTLGDMLQGYVGAVAYLIVQH